VRPRPLLPQLRIRPYHRLCQRPMQSLLAGSTAEALFYAVINPGSHAFAAAIDDTPPPQLLDQRSCNGQRAVDAPFACCCWHRWMSMFTSNSALPELVTPSAPGTSLRSTLKMRGLSCEPTAASFLQIGAGFRNNQTPDSERRTAAHHRLLRVIHKSHQRCTAPLILEPACSDRPICTSSPQAIAPGPGFAELRAREKTMRRSCLALGDHPAL